MGPFAEAKKFCGDKEAYLTQVKLGPAPLPPLSLFLSLLYGDWLVNFYIEIIVQNSDRDPKLFKEIKSWSK